MKTVLMIGAEPNQFGLAERFLEVTEVCGVILWKRRSSVSPKARHVLRAGLARAATAGAFRQAWFHMQSAYPPSLNVSSQVPVHQTQDVNTVETLGFLDALKPELVLVSGTNLLRNTTIQAVQAYARILNLHTGISPYVNGGPNCTNWCLFLREFDLIGSTIMWLNEGIDAGNIVATERAPLDGSESLSALHLKVMKHAHSLYLRAVTLAVGRTPLPNVPQSSLSEARLFMTKDWGPREAARALWNFRMHFEADVCLGRSGDRILVPLPS